MASKSRLRNAHGSLVDTLTNRFNQSPPGLENQWAGLMGQATALGRRVAASGLPDESAGFDRVIADLDAATHAIVGATEAQDPDEAAAALDQAGQALSSLDALLGS
jgi:hypothetical protein